jgi:hypothetical protein
MLPARHREEVEDGLEAAGTPAPLQVVDPGEIQEEVEAEVGVVAEEARDLEPVGG